MDEHSITPPPELVQEWATVNGTHYEDLATLCRQVAIQASQWGADQELEACCEWLSTYGHTYEIGLRAARRPKPPSPKEEALKVLEALIEWQRIDDPEYQALRHALEQLDD